MPFFVAAFAGFVLGAGVIGWWLNARWQYQTQEAKQGLEEIAAQYKEEAQTNRALKQQVADLQFQLNRAQNDLKAQQQQR